MAILKWTTFSNLGIHVFGDVIPKNESLANFANKKQAFLKHHRGGLEWLGSRMLRWFLEEALSLIVANLLICNANLDNLDKFRYLHWKNYII